MIIRFCFVMLLLAALMHYMGFYDLMIIKHKMDKYIAAKEAGKPVSIKDLKLKDGDKQKTIEYVLQKTEEINEYQSQLDNIPAAQ